MVANQYSTQGSNRRRIKQPASVPFLWEVRPGLPKKDWKPNPSNTQVDPVALPPVKFMASVPFKCEEMPGKPNPSITQVHPTAPPPVKLIASVPFKWEEMPGKPNPSITQVDPTAPPPVKLIASVPFKWEEMPGKPLPSFPQEMPKAAPLLLLPPPPSQSPARTVYFQNYCDNSDDDMYDSYLDAWGFEFDEESISSAPSLVANRMIPTLAITNGVPEEENVLMDSNSGQLQAPGSPAYESDSSTSSYATGNTSLVGAPFLERLFPLLSPKVSFLGKHGCDKGTDSTPQTVLGKDLNFESERSLVVKRPLTLGELILMSRRRSYHRKYDLIREQDLSMEFMKKNVLGCCMVGSGKNIKGLQGKWKQQLQLKPI